ncbi:hypothetical protein HELRODRAFT_188445 [Helobdella robusta]|uniref:RING-type E3 ubiquitin transferase n=1 Tax=Helobdella robusta TaxID=6412 RepID=T1FPZ7_HELRO|nr:hypothetical protein HELRODRAFT_188445 [Helobdella robusta]ESO06677.1 hypothetical protein HELRODRAFT_188445 [Helobdella robusta]
MSSSTRSNLNNNPMPTTSSYPNEDPTTSSSSSSSSSQRPSAGPSTSSGSNNSSQDNNSSNTSGAFECNICLDTARDAVVSMCGHLFCWPCLHQWLETRPSRKTCPVCKAGISKSKVIPLYGRGNTNHQDPRDKVPPRPQGQRSEPENTNSFPGFGFGEGAGFQMSFGIGAFPFGFFASTFNQGDGRNQNGINAPHPDERFLNRVFLIIALLFLFWLMMA